MGPCLGQKWISKVHGGFAGLYNWLALAHQDNDKRSAWDETAQQSFPEREEGRCVSTEPQAPKPQLSHSFSFAQLRPFGG